MNKDEVGGMRRAILLQLGLLLAMVALVLVGVIIADRVLIQPREHNSLKALVVWKAVGGVIGYVLVVFNFALRMLLAEDVGSFIGNLFRQTTKR